MVRRDLQPGATFSIRAMTSLKYCFEAFMPVAVAMNTEGR